jgi:hypothetical protein
VSSSPSSVSPTSALGNLPPSLRNELLDAYNEIVRNFREQRWEPAELNGGKLCEIVYSILKGHVDGAFPAAAYKPTNMVDACRALEQAGATFPRSVRIQIPRMLMALYEIRNNRGVGHVGGDVSANHMDAVVVLSMAKWIVAELVRLFHSTDVTTATQIVDALTERELPIIWTVAGKRRVLSQGLSMKQKMLLLLYSSAEPVKEGDLVEWLEHSNPSVFRRDVLRVAHKERLIEYDAKGKLVHLSPLGTKFVEANLPLGT